MGVSLQKEKKLEEKCGIVGVFSKRYTANLPLALLAAGGVQHRGQQGTGLVVKSRKRLLSCKDNGLLQQVFTTQKIKQYNKRSLWILVHCRYGTHGSYQKENLQPCIVTAKNGDQIAIVHNGEFAASANINNMLQKKLPRGTSDTYLFAQLLAQTEGETWEEKIITAFSKITGAFSLIIGVNDTLYAARDPFGIRPLIIGKIDNGWLIASETHAFDKVGAKVVRELQKGEIIRINKRGLKVIKEKSREPHHFCDFEWAYFSKPNSLLSTNEHREQYKNPDEWLAVNAFRERCGNELSKEAPVRNATFAVGVPDSGIALTTAYCHQLHIPYRQVIIRDHFDPNGIQRLFMRDDQKELIGKKVLGKLSLIPDKYIWKDAIVVVGDDSIVRGNVSAQITKAIYALGAKEIHWIIGFPQIMHRCHLGVSIRTRQELIAPQFNGNPKRIAKAIGATSVNYISSIGFVKARMLNSEVKIPKNPQEIFLRNGGCGGCITGLYPVGRKGEIYNSSSLSVHRSQHKLAMNHE